MLLFARENTLDLNIWTGADPYSVRAVCGKTQLLPANVAFVSSVSMVIGARRGRGQWEQETAFIIFKSMYNK